MKLIIGGAFQGKLTYARNTYNLKDEDIFWCQDTEINFSKPCINGIEEFTWACVKAGLSPVEYFDAHKQDWQDCILICEDIFCGVVPLGADQRRWRNETGVLCQYLSREARSVTRIFCGLEQKLK